MVFKDHSCPAGLLTDLAPAAPRDAGPCSIRALSPEGTVVQMERTLRYCIVQHSPKGFNK